MAVHEAVELGGQGWGQAVDCLQHASFDFLPLELRLKCLASCDWQTLSRVSCVNRGTRGLVAYLVRTPYWRTFNEEQPAVLTTDFGTSNEQEAACSKWAEGLAGRLCGCGKPDVCFVFASAVSHANLPIMLKALRSNLAKCTLLAGMVAPGVLGRDTESGSVKEVDGVERVGLVVSVLHLPPGSTVHSAVIKDGLVPDWSDPTWKPPEGRMPEGPSEHKRSWLVLSDRHTHVDSVLQELSRRYPGEPVCGGMGGSADGTASLIVGLPGQMPDESLHAAVTSGILLLSISGPGVEPIPMTTRGMRCISQRFMVSQVASNVDLSPVGCVTLVQQMQNSIALSTRADNLSWIPVGGSFTPTSALVAALQAQGTNVAPRAPLFFGVSTPGSSMRQDDPCKMVMLQMHDPNNLMRTSGYVSVQHPVERGMLAGFYTPEPALSLLQLRAQLEEVRPLLCSRGCRSELEDYCTLHHCDGSLHRVLSADPDPVYGCLMFPCVAKGSRYYDDPDVESKMLQAIFPGAALCGFFCNGEIGPTPPDELPPSGGKQDAHMMGYSTVMHLMKLTPAPPPPLD